MFSKKLRSDLIPLTLLALLALGLRLLVWHWRYFYPLGGDEQEYLQQAVALLAERRYIELRLMRPPLYPLLLAAWIYVVDSLVDRLRLVQAVIGALTVLPTYLMVRSLMLPRRVALVSAALLALSYTLAVNATELLTETVFLFGLMTAFWLLFHTAGLLRQGQRAIRWAAAAGVTLGLLCLVRSVALPLLPLGLLWLLAGTRARNDDDDQAAKKASARQAFTSFISTWPGFRAALALLLGCLLVILPWTARNYRVYGAPILIDTVGAENLWLDNEPAGREAAKAQLYAMNEDRAGRQRLALERGVAAITADPQRFVAKAGGELLKLFALEYTDDMRDRPSIYVSPGEVWARLILGDGLWLLLVFGGLAGVIFAPSAARDTSQPANRRLSALDFADPRWVFVPWMLYLVVSMLVFHVEPRYRLPLYPVLLPFTAWALIIGVPATYRRTRPRAFLRLKPLVLLLCWLIVASTLLFHRPYLRLAWDLGWKHYHIAGAERALISGMPARAQEQAAAALRLDGDSALARVLLARAALRQGDAQAALQFLNDALLRVPDHPHAHLLRGEVLRTQGHLEAAGPDLAYETASRQDLQAWAWDVFPSKPPAMLELGGELDLGDVRGFHAPEAEGYRWTIGESQLRLAGAAPGAVLRLRLATGPMAGAATEVRVLIDGQSIATLTLEPAWRDYDLALPPDVAPDQIVVTLRSAVWRPRALDRTSGDGRWLGVKVKRAELLPSVMPLQPSAFHGRLR